MQLVSEQPRWLVAGAVVRVRRGSRSSEAEFTARVLSVDWPWLVHLDGWPGGCHPWRVLGLAGAAGELEATDRT